MAFQDDNRGFQRKMYQGDWKCAKCEAEIKELPFEPRPGTADSLLCRDCFRKEHPRNFHGGDRR